MIPQGGLTSKQNVLKLRKYFRSCIGAIVSLSMALTPASVAQRAGQEALGLLGSIPGPVSAGAAERLRDYVPGRSFPQIGIGIARQACRRYADNPSAVSGVAAAGLENVCRPYLDDIGYGQPPSIEVPFRGGQCYARYEYIYQFRNPNTGQLQDSLQTVTGRLVGLDERSNQPQQPTKTGGPLVQQFEGGPIQWIPLGTTFESAPLDQSIRNVRRIDGGVDNCGNPPVVVTDPKPPPNPGPVREPFQPSPDIDIDIDVTIGPGGDITFDIGTGPITISPFPDPGIGSGGGAGDPEPGAPISGLQPGDIGSPAQPIATEPGGVASGCAPPNSVLVGIKIDILLAPQFGSEYDPLVRRGVCYAYMGTIGNLALDPSGVALRSGQMLFAPLDNLTCWAVHANTGYVLRVTPYYRALELEQV